MLGHEVRLMPPAYVKPYVKRQKNDAADAEAICEAVTRPTMRFVAVKSTEQQGVLAGERDTPCPVSHFECVVLIRDPFRVLHQGQRPRGGRPET